MFCLYVILTISYLRAQTIEASSLPILPIPRAPAQANCDFFSILTVYFSCKYFPYYACELLECLLTEGKIPAGAINFLRIFVRGEWCCWYFTNMAFLLSLETCYLLINQALIVTSPVLKYSLQSRVQISATPRAVL